MSPTPEAWGRLGRLLVARRVQIDPAFRNRQKFIATTGLNQRLVADLENARRYGYRDATLDAVEQAYRLAPGSIWKALHAPDLAEWKEFPDRIGASRITITHPDEDHTESDPQPWLSVIVNDDPEPEIPPGGFSEGRLGGIERLIWAEEDEPWQRRWAAIQMLRGQNAPVKQAKPPVPPERRADARDRDPGREA